jgi:hemoglobin-like flavoprotein
MALAQSLNGSKVERTRRPRRRTRSGLGSTMTPDQIALVQQSFQKVAPNALGAAALFYNRLFETAPQLKALFRGDMTEQHKKLMATLAVVVNGLDKIETVLPAAGMLARRHVGYGVTPEHYTVVGSALLWTLERGLGPDWNEDVADAWMEAYVTLSSFMIGEAYGRSEAAE